ncbi:hypothetical protein ACFVW2_24510 [Streptomyces sp. NPDC058171]
MVQTLPLPLPATLVDEHRIDLAAPYTSGWGVEAEDVRTAPTGEFYALYTLWRAGPGFREVAASPAEERLAYRILTRYAPDGTVLNTTLCCHDHPDGTPSAVKCSPDMSLCVLPDGKVALSGTPDRTHLLTPELDTVLAAWSMPNRPYDEEPLPGDPFVTSMSVMPSGRLLCVATEYGTHRYGNSLPNIVGLAETVPAAGHKPEVRALVSLDGSPAHQTAENDLRPHVTHAGAPVGLDNRPHSLVDHLRRDTGDPYVWSQSRLGRPAPIGAELFVVPVFARTYRGGSRGQPHAFLLVDTDGRVTGRLGGMEPWKDSPFTGHCFNLVADPHRGHAFHLNRYGLYAWTADGSLRARLATEEQQFKALTRFTPTEVSPDGTLVLVHRTQHLMLRIPIPDDLTELGPVVAEALRIHTKQRTALKKEWAKAWGPVVNWHWATGGTRPHRL